MRLKGMFYLFKLIVIFKDYSFIFEMIEKDLKLGRDVYFFMVLTFIGRFFEQGLLFNRLGKGYIDDLKIINNGNEQDVVGQFWGRDF